MCVCEHAVRTSINLQHGFIARQARQHYIAIRGNLRKALCDSATISNELPCLIAVPVINCQLEAGFQQPSCDWPSHIADTDKSKPGILLRDWFHDEVSLPCVAISAFDFVLAKSTWCTVSRRKPTIHGKC